MAGKRGTPPTASPGASAGATVSVLPDGPTDDHGLTPRQNLDEIAALLEARNRIDAQLARRVRAAGLQQAPEDDGQKSMQSWLRGHGWLTSAAAGQRDRRSVLVQRTVKGAALLRELRVIMRDAAAQENSAGQIPTRFHEEVEARLLGA